MPQQSRLSSVSSEPMIREYAQGAAQTNVQPVADFLAPTVGVATSFGRFKVYTEKNRFKIPNTLRDVGGRAVTLSFDVSDSTYNCAPHAIDFPVDKLEELEEKELENCLQEGAVMIAEVAGLAHERDVLAKAVATLGSGSAVTWTGGTPTDPVDDIDTQILTVIKAARYGSAMGVGVLFGATAWKRFKNATAVKGRFVVGQARGGGQTGLAIATTDLASQMFLGTPEVMVSYMVQDTAAEGLGASISFLMDNTVIIFAKKSAPTRRDPSFMKTFRLAGNWMVPGSYLRDDQRVEVAKFDWSEDIQITNSPAAALLTVS